ncbi:flavin monoamine oxidase family protein [Microvirga antarctica]|uniref:flavin monoamine oxidase family protein n=1 Tax=Microvirga antarctica TaxID=2819233 RepID=UPI001B312493|nr:NAD(P)/FAD-dependent oxidoreductase [Microvirga antarctica]
MPMTRRTALAAMASLATIRPSRASDVDVLIVGAGAAGLAAAKRLRASGFSFMVIESRDRVGGRAHTDTSLGTPFDAGAHYVHWAERNPWRGIATSLRVPLEQEQFGGGFRIYRGAVQLSDAERRRRRDASRDIERLVELGGEDRSFAEAVNGKPLEWADAASGITLFSLGEDPQRVSLEDYRQLWSGDDDIPAGGYGALVARYGADVPVSLNTPVTRLTWRDGVVAAETGRGTLRAKAAIVTVPVGVLKSGSLAFTPGLPDEILQALDGLGMGALTKVALRVDPVRFQTVNATDLFDAEAGGAAMSFELLPNGQDLVLAMLGGDQARALCRSGEREAIAYATDTLARMLGETIRKGVLAGRLADWVTDPHAQGSYSVARPGHASARQALRASVGDLIWFAGEASAGGGAMTVGGATLDGERAAVSVAERLAAHR